MLEVLRVEFARLECPRKVLSRGELNFKKHLEKMLK